MVHYPDRARKRSRLPPAAYVVPGSCWFVTIGTANRAAVFSHDQLAAAVLALCRERCRIMGATLDLACLMPDHAHLLLRTTGHGLVDVIRDIKSRSTRHWWAYGGQGSLWQRSFYDHGVRTPDDYDRIVTYILENPVTAGLVAAWAAYPFLTGDLLDGHAVASHS